MRKWLTTLLTALTISAAAQQAVLTQQRHFAKTIPAGNYSGITRIEGNRYAVADDKSTTAGFHMMTITVDSMTGNITEARTDSFVTCGLPNRDEEGICYVQGTNTVFVSGEGDGRIVEYDLRGRLTGRELQVPEIFKTAHSNGGFEALTYNAATHRFWTITENTLRADGEMPTISRKTANRLRLQSFADDMMPRQQYWYVSDSSAVSQTTGKSFLGVSGLAALDDGRIVVLEREVRITEKYIGSFVHVKLYVVNPAQHNDGDVLEKTLLTEFRTRLNLTDRSMANYEGLCVGPKLKDGRQVLLLVADSQNQYKGKLRDWMRTVVTDAAARPKTAPFLSTSQLLEAASFLPAPPQKGSGEFQNDTFYYTWGKQQRTDSLTAARAATDEVLPLSDAFAEAFGMEISQEGTPEIYRLVEGVKRDAANVNRAAKNHFRRQRPFEHFAEPSLLPTADHWYRGTYSYPSGHSMRGWTYALTLALVATERTEALMLRARQYAMNRVICGRHWKSDIDASLMEATALMTRLENNEAFGRQLEKAREEYRRLTAH